MSYFVHILLFDALDLKPRQLGQVGAQHLLEYVVLVHLVLPSPADVYLGEGLPNLQSELFNLLLHIL